MNVYEKLIECRVKLQEMNLKKSGKNKFAGYEYFELSDFLPQINKLFKEYKLISIISFTNEQAEMKIINAEKQEEIINFTSPSADAQLKGCHPIQNLGAVQTYQRRYLYTTALEIVESDALDKGTDVTKKTDRNKRIEHLEKLCTEKGYTTGSICKKYKKSSLNYLKDSEIEQTITGLEKLGVNNA